MQPLKGGYPIIFASNVFHNSQLIQKCRAAGTYKDMRTGLHHVFSIELGKNPNSTFDRVLLEFYLKECLIETIWIRIAHKIILF